MSETKVFRVSELISKAVSKRHETFSKGYDCGFKSGDEFMSYKLGYTTGIFSYGAQGKTQFYIEQAVYLSKQYGLKHAIWLTESGKKEELIMDIAMTYLGKSFFDSNTTVTDEEVYLALEWLDQFFFIIDHETKMLNIRDIYTAVADIEKKYNVKIQCVAIDNATNLAREPEKAKMMIHEYMNYLLTAINRVSLQKSYHTFILYHVNDPQFIECPTSKKRYLPPPSHFQIVGGQQVNFLSYQLVNVWRAISRQDQYGIVNPNTGVPFELNETQIIITKSKPKFVGIQGSYTLYFDVLRQQYYEVINNRRYYAGEYSEKEKGFVYPTKNDDSARSPKSGVITRSSRMNDFNDEESIF